VSGQRPLIGLCDTELPQTSVALRAEQTSHRRVTTPSFEHTAYYGPSAAMRAFGNLLPLDWHVHSLLTIQYDNGWPFSFPPSPIALPRPRVLPPKEPRTFQTGKSKRENRQFKPIVVEGRILAPVKRLIPNSSRPAKQTQARKAQKSTTAWLRDSMTASHSNVRSAA
jgi:hypothetical protein